jgi:WD40 repeat protein
MKDTMCSELQDARAAAIGCHQLSTSSTVPITAISQSPCRSSLFAVGRADGSLTLVNLDPHFSELAVLPAALPATTPLAHALAVRSIAFDVTGDWVVAASEDGMLRYYSCVLREEVASARVSGTPKVPYPPWDLRRSMNCHP